MTRERRGMFKRWPGGAAGKMRHVTGHLARRGVRHALAGSLTLEAAMALPLFLFAAILMALPMDFLDTHREIQMILESTGREISRDAFLLTAGGDGEKSGDPEDHGVSLLGSAAAGAFLKGKIERSSAAEKITDVEVSRCRISADGESIDLRVSWKEKLPFPVFTLTAIPMSARCLRRGWIGREGDSGSGDSGRKDERMVYVGRDSTRYHLSPYCHYISNEIRAISRSDVKTARNREGRHYAPCSVCGGGDGGGAVYVLPDGEKYHTRPDCSSLSSYVRQVPLSSVEQLGPCSYCGGGS
jgi:hypothetical protein